jgi:hypothetical protein
LTSGQIDTLSGIASKCPKEGGMVVYSARGLLQDCAEYLYSDNYENCYALPNEIETVEVNNDLILDIDSDAESNFGLDIFPNPASGQLNVNLNGFNEITIRLFDLRGIQMLKENYKTSGSLNLQTLKAGVYFLQIESEKGGMKTQKIVIF